MFLYRQEKWHPKYILANRHIFQFISYTSASCSHGRANQYYLESILNQANREGSSHNPTHHFMSTECESYEAFQNGTCEENIVVPMGEGLFPSM